MSRVDERARSLPQTGTAVIETEILGVGARLLSSIGGVLDSIPERPSGPQALARALGVDKVLTSRVLKAMRAGDPVAATSAMPGPEPLRRLVRGAARRGADGGALAAAGAAIDEFEVLIRDRIGDRSLLDSMLSAWVPQARREFELRRKQAAFKAMSQLKGAQADTLLASVLVFPSSDAERLDVVWLSGLLGLQRIRPGVRVKLTTRKFAPEGGGRRPATLDGRPIEDAANLVLDEFSGNPAPRLDVHRMGATVHYSLGDAAFGPGSGADIVFAEVNRAELPRFLPAGSNRVSYFFAESTVCAKVLQFDVLAHESLFTSGAPVLRIYDTSFEGVADLNDPSRDLDQFDLAESIEALGPGLPGFRSMDVPRYSDLLRHALDAMAQDPGTFRGWRCRIDYPVYGSQVAMAFKPATR